MNKKGFTLIELLATILILSLIMLVAVPNVMSTIDKNKKTTYIEDAKKMITLAEYEIRKDTSIPLPQGNNCIIIPLRSLELTDFTEGPEGGSYDLDNSYVLVIREGSKYTYLATIIENYGDNEKRGINLITRSELNKENANKYVVKNGEITVITPQVGASINGYTVAAIVNN